MSFDIAMQFIGLFVLLGIPRMLWLATRGRG
jgi:hypothetical protein